MPDQNVLLSQKNFFPEKHPPMYCRPSLILARGPTGAPPKQRPADRGSEPYLLSNNDAEKSQKKAIHRQRAKKFLKFFAKKS